MDRDNRIFLLQANLVSGVGPVFLDRLYQIVGGDYTVCYSWSAADFVARLGCRIDLAERLVRGLRDQQLLEKELQQIERLQVSWCTRFDDSYPALLSSIYAAPSLLMWRGSADAFLSEKIVAFVGARKADRYAQRAVGLFAPELVSAGVVLISGGARGADTYAHEAALEAGGKTVAVLGSGLSAPYPESNRHLFERIVDRGGAVVSPFPINMRAVPGNFPARNRIVSGLSSMTVVLQAARKSGALITAYCALEQGREVGVLPGSIFDELSVGCHQLLKQGAVPVCTVDDIFQACSWSSVNSVVLKQQNLEDSVNSKEQEVDVLVDPLVAACAQPQSFDDLAALFSDCESSFLHERIFDLCLSGKLEQDFTGKFCSL